uniref:RWD domain-containing protein n=1 Tax=Bactrocera dorsalis TaxID=27457 RepID=A0A034VGU1_BACDO
MSIINFEIEEIRKLCENTVPNSKIIACICGESPLVRVDITENESYRQLTVCLRFPTNYPDESILVELKSRTLSNKFLDGLATLSEKHARQHLGKPQGLHVLRFVQQYLTENPLCVCFDEIQDLRRDLGTDATPDQLKTTSFDCAINSKRWRILLQSECIFTKGLPERVCATTKSGNQFTSNFASLLERAIT